MQSRIGVVAWSSLLAISAGYGCEPKAITLIKKIAGGGRARLLSVNAATRWKLDGFMRREIVEEAGAFFSGGIMLVLKRWNHPSNSTDGHRLSSKSREDENAS